jgi:hypothetical protein
MTPSSSNGPSEPRSFTLAPRAQPARAMPKAAKATRASPSDPHGLKRLQRSRAQTLKGFKRLANAIMRDAIGIPLTPKQRAEIRAQRPKLDAKEVEKNSYRTPVFRQRSPRDMPKRRKAGWTFCRFVLPRATVEGLIHLAKTMADQERWERSSAPRGLRRRYPKTRNFYVLEGLNYVFDQYGMPEFCVQEGKVAPGQVRRFVAPAD